MRAASAFEVVAARAWNLLNEGKSFYLIFNLGLLGILVLVDPAWQAAVGTAGGGGLLLTLILSLPVLVTYVRWDFPLHLRWFLWLPFLAFGLLWNWPGGTAVGLSAGLYFFFTVVLWGTIYYHLRTGTTLWNFLRFWKLVLKNADSTSGNAQEQLPKSFLTLAVWQYLLNGPVPAVLTARGAAVRTLAPFLLFSGVLVLYAWFIHRWLFRWRPQEYASYATAPAPLAQPARRVIVIVIDGCRKDKLEQATTPFLDWLRERGTRFEAMETVYPARTVVCFSSMFTGTYPWEHGITSNLVLRLGVKVESVFDVLARHGRKGVLLGIAHLIDAFGDHVRAITSVQHGDEVDGQIMAAARQILEADDPDLLIVQLIATDQTGHARGVHYPEYLQRIREADAHIEAFFAWLHRHGYTRDTTFLICADHGQGDGIGGHGHLGEGERWVPFWVVGKNAARGRRVDRPHSIVSVAATLMHLLGLPLPGRARGPVLEEALDPGASDLTADLEAYFATRGRGAEAGGSGPVAAKATAARAGAGSLASRADSQVAGTPAGPRESVTAGSVTSGPAAPGLAMASSATAGTGVGILGRWAGLPAPPSAAWGRRTSWAPAQGGTAE